MADGGASTIIAAVAAPIIGSLLGGSGGGSSSPPQAPTAGDVKQKDIASATRRRALSRGGRASTILTDDSETPLSQQIPASQIGRATLLGGP